MRLPVNSELKDRITRFVAASRTFELREDEDDAFKEVFPDVRHFHTQARAFREKTIRPYVAVLYDEDDAQRADGLNVPIQAEDLNDVSNSYLNAMRVLDRSGIELKLLNDTEAVEAAFIDRLAESMAQMFANRYLQMNGPPVFTKRDTIVNSSRANDTILYAKGYFLSTGTAFGVSTPATAYLTPSRYSFGIMESGGPRFEGIVWSCPTTVRLSLP